MWKMRSARTTRDVIWSRWKVLLLQGSYRSINRTNNQSSINRFSSNQIANTSYNQLEWIRHSLTVHAIATCQLPRIRLFSDKGLATAKNRTIPPLGVLFWCSPDSTTVYLQARTMFISAQLQHSWAPWIKLNGCHKKRQPKLPFSRGSYCQISDKMMAGNCRLQWYHCLLYTSDAADDN